MSEAIAFDTHRYVKRLTENGFSEQQAEILADEQVALLNTNLATKSDIEETKSEIEETKSEIEKLRLETRSEIEKLRLETRSEIEKVNANVETLRQETKAEIERMKSDLLKWIFGAMIAQGGLIVALVKLL